MEDCLIPVPVSFLELQADNWTFPAGRNVSLIAFRPIDRDDLKNGQLDALNSSESPESISSITARKS